MSEDLPKGWQACKLIDVVEDVSYGYTAKAESCHSGTRMLRITDIQNNCVNWETVPTCQIPETLVTKYRLRPRDLVFARTGATVGKSFLLPDNTPDAVYASYLIRVRCVDPQMARFLSYFFQSPFYWSQITELSAGVAQPNVNGSKLKELTLKLPPLNEQQRIADKLDALLDRVNACRERFQQAQRISKLLSRSLLITATSGELTRDWRESRKRDQSTWSRTTVGELVDKIEAGLNVLCDERPPRPGERGLVKISAVTWGEFDEDASKTLPASVTVKESNRISAGDLLISRANTIELVGACVIVKAVNLKLYLSDKVLRLVVPEDLKYWLCTWLRSPHGREQIERLASGNQLSMRNLSQNNLRSIRIDVPPLDERCEIERRMEYLTSKLKSIDMQLAKGLSSLHSLTPSIISKAFLGELIAQDPVDESASDLLARIQSASTQASGTKIKPSKLKQRKGEPLLTK